MSKSSKFIKSKDIDRSLDLLEFIHDTLKVDPNARVNKMCRIKGWGHQVSYVMEDLGIIEEISHKKRWKVHKWNERFLPTRHMATELLKAYKAHNLKMNEIRKEKLKRDLERSSKGQTEIPFSSYKRSKVKDLESMTEEIIKKKKDKILEDQKKLDQNMIHNSQNKERLISVLWGAIKIKY
jgi:hypothetical protein